MNSLSICCRYEKNVHETYGQLVNMLYEYTLFVHPTYGQLVYMLCGRKLFLIIQCIDKFSICCMDKTIVIVHLLELNE